MIKNLKNVLKLFLIAQKKRPEALNAIQKKPSSLQGMVSKKNKKNPKIPILIKTAQSGNFLRVVLTFSETLACKDLVFLPCIQCIRALLLSYQKQLSDHFSDLEGSK